MEEINSHNLVLKFKVSEKDFTRKRKQDFSTTLLFLMNFLKKSLSIEIENFIRFVNTGIKQKVLKPFSKSAFVQCRKKIKPEVFKHLSSFVAKEFYTGNEDGIKRWKGFRLLSVDGSRLPLPNTKELRGIYGEYKNSSEAGKAQGRISVLYDVLNNYVLDGLLAPLALGENILAFGHLSYAQKGDLVIYDRGYPSFELVYKHTKLGVDFLIRTKQSFSNMTQSFFNSKKKSAILEMSPGKNTKLSDKEFNKNDSIKVRLTRIELSSGEVEILITSLLDAKKYPHKLFKELYFKRWKVETYYDELKNKLKLGCFSGYSDQSIQQDFNAVLLVSNIQTLLVTEINDELAQQEKQTKYQYKVNTNLSYGFLKDRVVALLFTGSEVDKVFTELKDLFRKHLVPVRPGRKNKREPDKYRNRVKPLVTKNQKDAI